MNCGKNTIKQIVYTYFCISRFQLASGPKTLVNAVIVLSTRLINNKPSTLFIDSSQDESFCMTYQYVGSPEGKPDLSTLNIWLSLSTKFKFIVTGLRHCWNQWFTISFFIAFTLTICKLCGLCLVSWECCLLSAVHQPSSDAPFLKGFCFFVP